MAPTDYESIADRYDANPVRHRIGPEPEIAARLGRPLRVLDVACGTGLWLAAQGRAFPDDIAWHGIDRSPGMLRHARARLPSEVELELGRAEALPYDDASFDVVSCRFATHHLDDLARALTEARRVVRDDGTVVLVNVVPELMEGSWLYRVFPEARQLDAGRFLAHGAVHALLEDRYAVVETEVRRTITRVPLEEALADVDRAETSQIAPLSPEVRARGRAALRAEGARIRTELALGRWVAHA